jgi:capsular polysaccharide export protein
MSGAVGRKGGSRRKVLFLQGPLAPLFRLIGDRIRAAGHDVMRINLCAGDWVQWHGPGCVSYRGSQSDWQTFIGEFLKSRDVTDLVLHGDQRFYHRVAIECARPLGVQVAVTELGVLRPGWMTLERNGLSTLSHFPADPEHIRRIAEAAGQVDLTPRFEGARHLQIVPDVAYNLLNVVCSPVYPHYRRHTIYHPVPEYIRGAIRMIGEGKRNAAADARIGELAGTGHPLFLLPLQLEGDFQLRRHSPYSSFAEVIDRVLASFSVSAPAEAQLLLKSHPLDVGFENWPRVLREAAGRYGLEGRVHYLDGGDLGVFCNVVKGVVTLNSTAGIEALQAGVPIKTLVPAHYDIEGLTHRGDLEMFWNSPEKPNRDLLDQYIRAIAATIQVRGSIYNKDGLPVAARNMAERILERRLNEPDGFVDPPPRLARARSIGVPL